MYIEYELNGSKLDLYADTAEMAEQIMPDVEKLNDIAVKAILADYKNGGESDYYIKEWRDNIDIIFTEQELVEIKDIPEAMLSKLRLVALRIDSGAESFLVMDYAFGYNIDQGFRDDMLVVRLNRDYEPLDISNEG